MNHRVQHKKNLTIHHPEGSRSRAPKEETFLLNLPEGFPGGAYALHKKCVLTAAICGYYRKLYLKDDSCSEWPAILRLKSDSQSDKKQGGLYLVGKIIDWTKRFKLKPLGPYPLKETLASIASQLSVQYHVFSESDKWKLIFSTGRGLDYSIPQIYLLLEKKDASSHLELITDLKKFFSAHKASCLSCKMQYSPHYTHKCKNLKETKLYFQ